MLCEAKYNIIKILEGVEKKISSSNEEAALKKIMDLKEKVDSSMSENDSLRKWSDYKTTPDFKSILSDFKDALWFDYPEMDDAKYYFQRPCFFNED